MNRYQRIALCLGLLPALTGCLATENRSSPVSGRAASLAEATTHRGRPALDKDQIEQFGFQVYWDSNLRDEVITSVSLEGDQIYAFTGSKRLYQIDVHSGKVNWVYDVGRDLAFADSHPIAEWVYLPDSRGLKQYDEIFFVAQDHLYALDKKHGSLLWTTYLPFTASSPPRSGSSHVYVGGWDDRIYGIRKDTPSVPDWSWNTGGDVLARPVFDNPSLFVSSSDGRMYTFDASSGAMKWPYETGRPLKRDPLLYKSLLYLPSDDFNLYVLGTDDGLLHYKFCAQAPITRAPIAIDKTIYFSAGVEGVFALLRKGRPQPSEGNPRKTQHELLWQRKGADQVLCKGKNDIYVLEPSPKGGHQVVARIDAKDGHFRDSLEVGGVDYWLTNPFDPSDAFNRDASLRGGIVFLGYRNGWIVALKETATIPGA